jgi:hypothetical protein
MAIGGSETHSHETIPFCHFGLFEASKKKAATSSAGRPIVRFAVICMVGAWYGGAGFDWPGPGTVSPR